MMRHVGDVAGGQTDRVDGFAAPGGDGGRWVAQLAHVAAQLAAAETMEAITSAAVSHGRDAIQAAVATLMLLDGEQLRMVSAQGVRPGVQDDFAEFGLQDLNPASEAVRDSRTVLLSAADGIEARYPVLSGRMPPGRSLVCLPLRASGEPLGVIGLTFEQNWLPGPRELDLLSTFADSCAQAIRRVRAIDDARQRAWQQEFLVAASSELARSLDYRQTLSNVANLAVPILADWCAVSVLREGRLTNVAVAHEDPAKVAWAWELQDRYPPDMDAPTGPAHVIRTGSSELYPEITDDMLRAGARDAEHLRLTRDLALRSAILAPLATRGRALGVLTLLRSESRPSFGLSELALAEEVARRAGIAIDNSDLFTQSRDAAALLQRAVLPTMLTPPPGWSVATYYSAGGRGEVGGDFYDAIALDGDHKVALVIGDVMGHGVAAAAAMAQLRAAVHAFMSIDPAPDKVVSRLDRMYSRLHLPGLASLVYALIHPTRGEVSMVNAGHFPPLVVDHAGIARLIHAPSQRMLGAGGDDRSSTTWPMSADDTLLLYTDGLVERRRENIDTGLARLVAHAGGLSGSLLQSSLDALVAALGASESADDVTAIAARYTGPLVQVQPIPPA
jgi:serine phosphatase RsbU (regulator of sigma subunit)